MDITFSGDADGTACEHFIRDVRQHAFNSGKTRDTAWIADYASTCFVGGALRWYETLDDEVLGDWKSLRQALLARWPADSVYVVWFSVDAALIGVCI